VLHAFTGGVDGAWPQGDLVFDAAGSLYGTTMNEGVDGGGTAFKLTPGANGWSEAPLHQFTGGKDGGTPKAGMIRSPAGVLYGTASSGGSASLGAVFRLRPYALANPPFLRGWEETPIYSFMGGASGQGPDTGLVLDQAGNLDGVVEGGSNNWGLVYQLTPGPSGWTQNVLYTFTGGADGGFPEATATLDGAGNLYGGTVAGGTGCGVIYKIKP